jgi:hypothetical protein
MLVRKGDAGVFEQTLEHAPDLRIRGLPIRVARFLHHEIEPR